MNNPKSDNNKMTIVDGYIMNNALTEAQMKELHDCLRFEVSDTIVLDRIVGKGKWHRFGTKYKGIPNE